MCISVATYRETLISKLQLETTQYEIHTQKICESHIHDETTNIHHREAFIPITSDDKVQIYKKWADALIIKVYGKVVGLHFLLNVVRQWQPCFQPSKATFSYTSLWVCLPELPT